MNAITPLKADRRSGGTMSLDAIDTPHLDRWHEVLTNPPRDSRGEVDMDRAELIPLEQIDAVRRDIARTLQPAEPQRIVAYMTALLMAYPQRVGEDAKILIAAAAEDLDGYPPQVIRAAMIEARRTLKFIPTIAELRELCDKHLVAARGPLLQLEKHRREHQRRDAEAECTRKRAEERQAFADRLRECYGADGPTPEDVDDAWTMLWRWNFGQASSSLAVLGRWRRALNAGEPWAAELCRIATKWAREHRRDDGRIEPPSPKVARRLTALRDAHCNLPEAA